MQVDEKHKDRRAPAQTLHETGPRECAPESAMEKLSYAQVLGSQTEDGARRGVQIVHQRVK